MKINSMPLLLTSIAAFGMTMTGYTQSPPKVTVRLSQAVYWATEGNDTVLLTVERGNGVEQEPFTVEYATSDLTAKAGLDYQSAAGVLSFVAGETNKTVAIKILNDELLENEESFRVTLTNLTGWALMGTPATATVKVIHNTVLRALNSGANLTHTPERESVPFSFASATGPVSVLGDLPELGNNNTNYAVRLVRGADSVWRATVSLPASRAYTYRFYQGGVPASDPISAQTRSVFRQPAAKTVYYHSSLASPVFNWRHSSTGAFTATPMLRIGAGRQVGEGLWSAAGIGESGREIEFFVAEPSGTARDPALGNHWTCLDTAFLQDGHLFNYMPAATVSPHRRDYDPDAPPFIRSTILNADRRYRVMLPRGYAEQSRRRYPVIYFHDGGAQWEIFPGGIGRTVVDPEGDIMAGLIRQGIMGEVIAVGIDIETGAANPQAARVRDYTPPGDQFSGVQGAADKYVQFIMQELKPVIDARYRTRPGPESTFTAGQSSGANVAVYMAWDFSHVFTRAGTHSGAFENAPNFTARIKREFKRDIRIYLDSGEDFFSGVVGLRDNLVGKAPPFVLDKDLRYVYSRGQQHLTEDFGSRRPMMLSFLYPATEETNELVPRLQIIRQNGTRLSISGPAGISGRLQHSTDLSEWSDLQSLTFGRDPVEISASPNATATQQFYRVMVP
ncbi:MAG TPA: alpha/beta hydrolase-fold protein [Verrucomicrobiae bacterium]|nr:alpha/beta hydrolase-fold protein [Verrucomicrobiae bacterium]